MAGPGRSPRPPLQQLLPGTAQDAEAAGSKYAKRRRRGGLGLSPALAARGAAAVAAGVGLALLLLAGFHGLSARLSTPASQQPEPLERGGLAGAAVQQQQHGSGPAEAGGPTGGSAFTLAAAAMPRAAAPTTNCSCPPLHLDATERQQMAAEVAATLAAMPHRPSARSVPDAAPAEARSDVVAPGQAVSVPGAQPVRVVDQSFGPQSSENIPGAPGWLAGGVARAAICCRLGSWAGTCLQPALATLPLANKPSTTARHFVEGVEDLHAELKAYNDALLAGMTLDEREAAARQHRTTAAELGLLPLDSLNDTASLLHRIAFLNGLYEEVRRGVQGERGGSCGSKPAGGLGWGACTSGRKRCCAFCAV